MIGALFLFFCLLAPAALPVKAAAMVGTGTAASCTEASLDAALTGGGVITFNCGPNPYNIPITSLKTISTDTTLDGTGPGITLDAKNPTQFVGGIFQVNNGVSFTVKNLSIINGKAASNGAAINAGDSSSLVIINTVFNNNISTVNNPYEGGGAIFLGPYATATITGSQFTYNKAPSGGAIASRDSESLTISGSTFLGNVATGTDQMPGGDGGAIYSHGVSQTPMNFQIEASKVYSNVAKVQGGGLSVSYINATQSGSAKTVDFAFNNTGSDTHVGQGGGVYVEQGLFTLSGSAVYSSVAPDQGGGIFIRGGGSGPTNVTIENTSIGNNRVYNPGSHGGGISRTSGTLKLTNITVAGNSSQLEGGGIYTGVTGTENATVSAVTLTNSVVTGNTISSYNYYSDCSSPVATSPVANGGFNFQYNPQTTGPYDSVNCTAGITKQDPKLTALINLGGPTPIFGLMAGSPALDVIPSENCTLNVDQRGFPRPYNAKCDSGAFEGVVKAPTLTLSFNPATVGPGGVSTLTFSLTNPSSPETILSGISFKDDLPGSLKVAAVPNLNANCAGPNGNPLVTFTNSGGTINVNSLSLSTGQTCTISVDVVNQLSSGGSLVTQVSLVAYLGNQSYNPNAQATLTVVPGAPSNLTATVVSSSQIHLAWQAGAGTNNGYRIERSNNGTSNFQFLTNVGAGVTAYDDTGLAEASTYYYRVSAVFDTGTSQPSNNAGATTPLNPPTNLTASVSGSQVTLNWTNNSTHQTGFKVERRTGTGGAFVEIATATTPPYTDGGLTSGTLYFYRVRAVNATPALTSAYSNQAGVAVPGSLVVTQTTDDGTGNTPGSLSAILAQAANASNNKTITFNLVGDGNTVTVNTGVTLTIGSGVTLAGNCNSGPGITIKGANLQLGGSDILFGLRLTGPGNGAAPLLTNKITSGSTTNINTPNTLSCVSVKV